MVSKNTQTVKIMLTGLARLAERLSAPRNLSDLGGHLRRAAGWLGIVIDTPRLDTQKPFADQADDVAEALEAALRLQKWRNENGDTVRSWTQTALLSRRAVTLTKTNAQKGSYLISSTVPSSDTNNADSFKRSLTIAGNSDHKRRNFAKSGKAMECLARSSLMRCISSPITPTK
jgi:hypothetical protein